MQTDLFQHRTGLLHGQKKELLGPKQVCTQIDVNMVLSGHQQMYKELDFNRELNGNK